MSELHIISSAALFSSFLFTLSELAAIFARTSAILRLFLHLSAPPTLVQTALVCAFSVSPQLLARAQGARQSSGKSDAYPGSSPLQLLMAVLCTPHHCPCLTHKTNYDTNMYQPLFIYINMINRIKCAYQPSTS